MIPTLLRYSDLKERGIVENWQTLSNWIEREGFPPGRLIGPNTRAWTTDEVGDWLASRPAAPKPTPLTANHVSRRRRKHSDEGE